MVLAGALCLLSQLSNQLCSWTGSLVWACALSVGPIQYKAAGAVVHAHQLVLEEVVAQLSIFSKTKDTGVLSTESQPYIFA